ncbi:hypothetical protein CCYA_CCYA07G1977 [Cyanidiococcus yangmingshanensis]|uniref:Gtf2a2p n=1 Tax=Cyanidiococcus yangmingshanensis TaxID=2690220 RepID=A0A7J7IK43_9RHOD|nr:Gtf2a2p [Cyanidiococcus yangmingshanensis]KAK4531120.1 hypothetical protein CCYA_CCYA07G1977 [Cyanidiococcus yangmingshanensis]
MTDAKTSSADNGGGNVTGSDVNQSGAFYAHYRASTIGLTLEDVLEELLSSGRLREAEATLIRGQFDQVVARYLRKRVSQRSALRGRLSHYNLRDNVWTFLVRHALLRLEHRPENYAVVERFPKRNDGSTVTFPGAPTSLASEASLHGLFLPTRSETRDGRMPNTLGTEISDMEANTQAYVYVDRLRLICTAADANIVKATSGSSRRKRSAAPMRSRPRPRPASVTSVEK